ncbi:hypothetical protein EGW08_012550 [Elysia chlorotica]|uniref:Uncharacterized protein n=1 Tax=Elysia chlorotica TaxID=188477 RepID=A0A433TDR7_ELYCH|nr:hypothetical protein EGW08_012550 [Elysia chlorotica]
MMICMFFYLPPFSPIHPPLPSWSNILNLFSLNVCFAYDSMILMRPEKDELSIVYILLIIEIICSTKRPNFIPQRNNTDVADECILVDNLLARLKEMLFY